MAGVIQSFVDLMRLIKVSHTLFALPFALASYILAASRNGFELYVLLFVLSAMVCMRSAAMSFNRLVDADIDAKNPRTKDREIPAGKLSKRVVFFYVILFSAGFFYSAYKINELTFQLSPIAWMICLGYSFCKRWTFLCHVVLGIALGLSPIGAWIAVTGEWSLVPVLMGVVVMFWTTGFDILYACLDYDFDKANKLSSIPSYFGIQKSLVISRFCHVCMLASWIVMIWYGSYGLSMWIALILSSLLIILEHCLVSARDLGKMNVAFFKLNVIISLTMLVGVSFESAL